MMLNLESGAAQKKSGAVHAEDGIAMRCRVRLARNLAGERFPDWATERDRERVLLAVRDALRAEEPGLPVAPVAGFGEQERDMMCEAHLISKDLLERAAGGGVALSEDGSVCVMINEEDHLRIQGFADGLDLRTAWRRADALDSRLERHLNYAWTPRLGYLTACPSNVGTGLRASAMLHLLGLRLLGEIEAVVSGLERMRLLVRGIGGEGSDAAGQIYQISNMDSLGADEETVIRRVTRICAEVVRQELNARARLLQESPLVLVDCLARSLSVLQNARLLATAEALEFLSAMRLGASMGLCTRLKVKDVDALIVLMQPGHLQKGMGVAGTSDERDELRADFLSRKVANVKLKV
ncbi:MAG: ATP--guanido phosphotransferase [Verrucomicrobiota bacterium]|jgi:protein arginine kinase|nr:ATP--guanido phosphotransferase [Verrucomicrobiota bacterium]